MFVEFTSHYFQWFLENFSKKCTSTTIQVCNASLIDLIRPEIGIVAVWVPSDNSYLDHN